jgi:hypothetical protein
MRARLPRRLLMSAFAGRESGGLPFGRSLPGQRDGMALDHVLLIAASGR